MKNVIRSFGALIVVAFMLMPVMRAAGQSTASSPAAKSLTVAEARQAILDATKYMVVHGMFNHKSYFISPNSSNIRFTPSTLVIDLSGAEQGMRYKLNLKSLESVSFNCTHYCSLGVRPQEGSLFLAFSMLPPDVSKCPGECRRATESFVAALNRLHAFANENAATEANEFRQQAAAWRALPSKPPIPEAVRQRRLLAENALQEKHPLEALNLYEDGLKIYPTWPQGHFNAALISASLEFYEEAIEHMQGYLELVPDARDAQSARDQIVIWQHKAGQHGPGVPR